jgi:hypothetical protein
MLRTRRTHRPAIVCALAIALLAAAIIGPTATAGANAGNTRAAAPQALYYTSYGTPQSDAAAAQGRYYASYGTPEPLTLPQSPAASDDTPWLPIALALAVVLALTVASATQLRRLRTRRRTARAAA